MILNEKQQKQYNIIYERAKAHKDKYPKFCLERFMEYIDERAKEKPTWLRYALGRSISQINKQRRSIDSLERWVSKPNF